MFIIGLIWVHFIADFLFQSQKMSMNKYNNVKWLSFHVVVYTLPFIIFGWKFAIINGIIHFLVDFFTSKGTHYLYEKNEYHWFFCLIGFDQAIHITTLILTYIILVQ